MMRLACTSLSFGRAFKEGQLDLVRFIDICKDLDLDGVDLNTATIPTEDASYLKEIKLRCLRYGLSIACVSISNNFGRSAEQADHEVEMTKRWIGHALLLGAPQVRVFAGTVPSGADRTEAWERAERCLKEVADYGYQCGIRVALQNHNHGALTPNGDDVLRFIERAGPHLGHVWDTGQYVGSPGASGASAELGAQEILYENLRQTAHLATHVRAKFYRIETGVERWLDYPRIFSILHGTRYNGFCSIVYEGPDDELKSVQLASVFLRPFLIQAGRPGDAS